MQKHNFGNLIFSVGEKEIIDYLMHNFNQTFTQAVDRVIIQKREAAALWRRQGNHRLADQLLREIGDIQ